MENFKKVLKFSIERKADYVWLRENERASSSIDSVESVIDALLVLQRSQQVKVFNLHKASIMSGQSEKSYNLEIVYVAG